MEVRSVESIVRALNDAQVDYLVVGGLAARPDRHHRTGVGTMISPDQPIAPDWKWGTSEGSREFDRLTDRRLTCHEILEWLEEAETLSLHFQAFREKAAAQRGSAPLESPADLG